MVQCYKAEMSTSRPYAEFSRRRRRLLANTILRDDVASLHGHALARGSTGQTREAAFGELDSPLVQSQSGVEPGEVVGMEIIETTCDPNSRLRMRVWGSSQAILIVGNGACGG